MRKNTESMMKGAALGLLAGGAVGAAGAYVAQKNPKEMKKMMKKIKIKKPIRLRFWRETLRPCL